MRNIDALREHFETSNTCWSCGARWKDETPTPSILHRTVVCATCAASPLVIVRAPVRSSNIRSLGYRLNDEARLCYGTLDVEFLTGRRVYRYFFVPASVYEALRTAPSIGEAFTTLIKWGGFRYVVLPLEDAPDGVTAAATSESRAV